MEGKGPSQTAVWTAMLRAAHYLLDAEPKILADPFARIFAGFSSDGELFVTGASAKASPSRVRLSHVGFRSSVSNTRSRAILSASRSASRRRMRAISAGTSILIRQK